MFKKKKKIGVVIFRGHSTREPASSRMTYFILRAYIGTTCSQHRRRFWKKCRCMDRTVDISKEEMPGSKRSMYDCILTYSRRLSCDTHCGVSEPGHTTQETWMSMGTTKTQGSLPLEHYRIHYCERDRFSELRQVRLKDRSTVWPTLRWQPISNNGYFSVPLLEWAQGASTACIFEGQDQRNILWKQKALRTQSGSVRFRV